MTLISPESESLLGRLRRQQNLFFLLAAGISSIGSFAGLITKGWLINETTHQPLLLAINFACLSLPALVFSQHAGVLTDRRGAEFVLIRAQWWLLLGSLVAALGYPLFRQATSFSIGVLIASTLVVGIASSYELTARTKYVSLLVPESHLPSYLAQFSVVFNVAKLVGPPIGGFALAFLSAESALVLDSLSYLVPIGVICYLMTPHPLTGDANQGQRITLRQAWQSASPQLQQSILFTALVSVIGFCHPALVPVMAKAYVGPTPTDLGWLTSIIALGSITAGLLLQQFSQQVTRYPRQFLALAAATTAIAQVGLFWQGVHWGYAMAFLIGAGTAGLLAGGSIIGQALSPLESRGRIAALTLIAGLGGGGISSLMAGSLVHHLGLNPTMGLLGLAGLLAAGGFFGFLQRPAVSSPR
jgi:MFS family permease